jgi:hypothetical protein
MRERWERGEESGVARATLPTLALYRSPLSPCPGLAFVFDFERRSAASDRPTSTTLLNSPFLFRRTYRLSPGVGSISVRFEVFELAFFVAFFVAFFAAFFVVAFFVVAFFVVAFFVVAFFAVLFFEDDFFVVAFLVAMIPPVSVPTAWSNPLFRCAESPRQVDVPGTLAVAMRSIVSGGAVLSLVLLG